MNANYYKMALQGAGFKVDDKQTELILQIVRLVDKKGGDVDLKDITDTQANVENLFKTPILC